MCAPPEVKKWHDPCFSLNERLSDPLDSELGRFISKDPIGLDGGTNSYSYGGNNSVSFVDPYGLKNTNPSLRGNSGSRNIPRGERVADPPPGHVRVYVNGQPYDMPHVPSTSPGSTQQPPGMVPRYPARPVIGVPNPKFNPRSETIIPGGKGPEGDCPTEREQKCANAVGSKAATLAAAFGMHLLSDPFFLEKRKEEYKNCVDGLIEPEDIWS